MTGTKHSENNTEQSGESQVDKHLPSRGSTILRGLVALLILGIAGGIAYYFTAHQPKSEKTNAPERSAVIVDTTTVAVEDHPAIIHVMGQVRPARETSLRARVSGEIISVAPDFVPGGAFEKGEELLRLDPSDYELDLNVKQAALAQARAALKLEQGQQTIAKDELKILEQTTGRTIQDSDLALRKPQLEQAQADLAAAKANVALAELNLKRTHVKSPFNAIITARSANLGDVVSTQETLATLVSTDEYWIDIDVPVQQLNWLHLPISTTEKGSRAIIELDGGRGIRHGKLLKITGTLNAESRLANVLVSVPDPLLLREATRQDKNVKAPLVLGDYVKVALIGKTLKNAAKVPHAYIRDGNTLWLAQDGKLVIKKADIVYEDQDYAYIQDGITARDQIITTDIITPIDGMDIKHQNTQTNKSNPAEAEDITPSGASRTAQD